MKKNNDNKQNSTNTNINWYPGHMAKTKNEIKKIIDLVDVVVEVIDARIPISSKVEDIKNYTFNKKRIIVVSKYDLCDKSITDKHIKNYEKDGYIVIPMDLTTNSDTKKLIIAIEELMVDVNDKRKTRGLLPKKAKVLVVGVPNVGKSTLINRLVNKNIASTGNKPGVTKALSTIKINERIDLIDTPGILWPKIKDITQALNLASMTSIKEEVIQLDKVAIHILEMLDKHYKDILKAELGIDEVDFNDLISIYAQISKFKHIPLLDDEADYDKINTLIVNLIKQEKIKGITFDY